MSFRRAARNLWKGGWYQFSIPGQPPARDPAVPPPGLLLTRCAGSSDDIPAGFQAIRANDGVPLLRHGFVTSIDFLPVIE